MTTTTERVDGAAQHLVAARHAGVPGPLLPDACRPQDVDTALAIQHRVADLLGETIGGWKCALPPPDRVIVAPIFASTIREADGPYRVVGGPIVRIEPEIAFMLDRDLPARAAVRRRRRARRDSRSAHRARSAGLPLCGAGPRVEVRTPRRRPVQPGLCVGPVVQDGLNAPLETLALSFEGALNRTIDGRHPTAIRSSRSCGS
jgi:hypothetical protein